MDIYEYWLEHVAELVFGPEEQEEERQRRVEEWHQHLWDTL
jgi:hypothetical protein